MAEREDLTLVFWSRVRVPEQLSVVGCGDDVCSHFILPQLTTVHLPAEEMAERGVREIERLVREPVPIEPRQHLVPVALVARASTGSVATALAKIES